MIDCTEIVSELAGKLKACEYFADKKVFAARQSKQKPTVPDKAAVVCGIAQIKARDVSLGQNIKAGEISVFADVCAPFHMRGFDFEQAAQEIIRAWCGAQTPAAISVSEVRADADMQCFIMRVGVAFSDLLKTD